MSEHSHTCAHTYYSVHRRQKGNHHAISNNSSYSSGFTLIELLIVIAILGLLVTTVYVNFNPQTNLAGARDATRTHAMESVQKALELYRLNNGAYPSTGGQTWGPIGSRWTGKPTCDTQTDTGYIPGLCPKYISPLPNDPNFLTYNPLTAVASTCSQENQTGGTSSYFYRSDGTDYKFVALCTPESHLGDPNWAYYEPAWAGGQIDWAVYSPGAKMWVIF